MIKGAFRLFVILLLVLKKQKQANYVSVWKSMPGPEGKPWDALFIDDSLHMNVRGYDIWQKIVEPYLEK